MKPSQRDSSAKPFADRRTAGAALATRLDHFAGRADALVLALPRGGVPVGYEVAAHLGIDLDVLIVRKLGVPGHEEFAMGAVASGGTVVLDHDLIAQTGLPPEAVKRVLTREQTELSRREAAFRGERPPVEVKGRTVILVDDGLATGWTMRAAVELLRTREPARLVVAVPIASQSTCSALGGEVDEMICLVTPEPFRAVGLWYEDFSQTTDDEVRYLLARASDDCARRTVGGGTAARAAVGNR
jgi:predicted phosphoribosyltransferase